MSARQIAAAAALDRRRRSTGLPTERRCPADALKAVAQSAFVDVMGLRVAARKAEDDGDIGGAERHLRDALAADPSDGTSVFELAEFLFRRSRYAEAEPYYDRLLAAFPDHPALLNCVARLWSKSGRRREAIALWGKLHSAKPELTQPLINIALTLRALGEGTRAVEFFERALAIDPDLFEGHYNLGVTYLHAGEHAMAIAHLEAAAKLRPAHARASVVLAEAYQAVCDWAQCDRLMPSLHKEAEKALNSMPCAITPWYSLRLPFSRAERRAIAAVKSTDYERDVAPVRARLGFTFPRTPKEVLTIGYVSGDFREHPMLHLSRGMFRRHDRRRFRVNAYPVAPPDDAGWPVLRDGFDSVADLSGLSDADAARRIHADGVDILVDIAGFNQLMRPMIVALRPAPVQVSWLSFAGTLSGQMYDALIGDPVVTPREHEADYLEPVKRMPHSYQINDRDQPIAPAPPRAAECLPDDGFVFVCFCTGEKIERHVFGTWMDILRAVDGSVLWLLGGSRVREANLRAAAAERGVDPARLVFAARRPKAEHLGRLTLADLHFDTGTYGAHTTGSDALWAGVPLITKIGDTFPSRVAASLLHAVGLPELVTESWEEYRAQAVRLAREPASLAAIKEKLAAHRRTEPLFDTDRFVRDLEAVYRELWNTHAARM